MDLTPQNYIVWRADVIGAGKANECANLKMHDCSLSVKSMGKEETV